MTSFEVYGYERSTPVGTVRLYLPANVDCLHNLASEDDKDDTIFAESSMKYIESLGLPTDDASPFVVLYLVQAPSVGTIERKGYIAGWKNAK